MDECVLPVAFHRWISLLNLKSWAKLSAVGVVLSLWSLILGTFKITVSSMGGTESR